MSTVPSAARGSRVMVPVWVSVSPPSVVKEASIAVAFCGVLLKCRTATLTFSKTVRNGASAAASSSVNFPLVRRTSTASIRSGVLEAASFVCVFSGTAALFSGARDARLSAPFLSRRINSSGDFTSTLPRLSVLEKTSSESIATASNGNLISASLSRAVTAN